jgi:hypothetical protein
MMIGVVGEGVVDVLLPLGIVICHSVGQVVNRTKL